MFQITVESFSIKILVSMAVGGQL